MTYAEFLARKAETVQPIGEPVSPSDVHPFLHDWQRQIVAWAVTTGCAALWEDTGLGKTVQSVEWARLSGKTSLIVAPLAVCQQTVREAAKVDVTATYVRDGAQITGPGVWVTNYEMVERFDPSLIDAVVLDEASILKSHDGKTRTRLIQWFRDVPRKLACTATPAPNDPEELTNQAEFLGVSTRANMLAAYFVHDSDGWRLKGHARQPMFRWMASWAVAIRKPSDLGYPDDGYELPELNIIPELLPVDTAPEGQLFATDLGGVGGRASIRRQTLDARVRKAVELVYDCRASSRVQPQVERAEPGPRTGVPGSNPGSTEPASAGKVRAGLRAPGTGQGPGQRVEPSESTDEPSVNLQARQTRPGADAGSGLPDLPSHVGSRPASPPSRGPRPSDGHGPRCSVPAVQSGTRTPSGRSDQGHGDVRLPHACRDQWLIWCGLNSEQDALAAAFGNDCVSLDGRTSLEEKVELERAWRDGHFRILITKPAVYMFGLNWQHCARMAFVGMSDSYEAYYQCIRRCYRYGQRRVVNVHIVLSDLESQIATNVARKEREASDITAGLVAEMRAASRLEIAS